MNWIGELKDKGMQASLRVMSEPHDFDPNDFQPGAFATGALYAVEIIVKDELAGTVVDKGWEGIMEESGSV